MSHRSGSYPPGLHPDRHTGQRIKELRLERGLTLRDLTGPGVTHVHVFNIENGDRSPSWTALAIIAQTLDTSALALGLGLGSDCPICGH